MNVKKLKSVSFKNSKSFFLKKNVFVKVCKKLRSKKKTINHRFHNSKAFNFFFYSFLPKCNKILLESKKQKVILFKILKRFCAKKIVF